MAILSWLRHKRPDLCRHGLPVLLSAAIPLLVYFLVMLYYGVQISKATFLIDLCFLGYMSALFGLCQRNRYLAVVPFVIVTTILLVAAVQKYVMLNVWVRFSDLTLLDEAWLVLPIASRVTLVLLAALAVGIAVWNRRLPHSRSLLLFIVLPAVAVSSMAFAPGLVLRGLRGTTNAVFGNDPLYRSVFFAMAYDFVEQKAFEREATIMFAASGSQAASLFSSDEIQSKRNVHIFVLESFMDPLLLGIPLPDPIDPRIRNSLSGNALCAVMEEFRVETVGRWFRLIQESRRKAR